LKTLALITLLLPVFQHAQHITGTEQADYRELFREHWKKAEMLLSENEPRISQALKKYDVPYNEIVAVVFPELLRYSALRDRMETGVLKALYVNLGTEYANFSIGLFQIKPSFAEKICSDVTNTSGLKRPPLKSCRLQEKSSVEYRKSIVSALEDPVKELEFVIAFYQICHNLFRNKFNNDEEWISFLSTAYNTGYWKDEVTIKTMELQKNFHLRPLSKQYYSYSDISLYWFRNNPISLRK